GRRAEECQPHRSVRPGSGNLRAAESLPVDLDTPRVLTVQRDLEPGGRVGNDLKRVPGGGPVPDFLPYPDRAFQEQQTNDDGDQEQGNLDAKRGPPARRGVI